MFARKLPSNTTWGGETMDLGGAVETQVSMTVEAQERLKNVQHLCHLCEDQYTMRLGFHPPQQNIQRLQLTYIQHYRQRVYWTIVSLDHRVTGPSCRWTIVSLDHRVTGPSYHLSQAER